MSEPHALSVRLTWTEQKHAYYYECICINKHLTIIHQTLFEYKLSPYIKCAFYLFSYNLIHAHVLTIIL